MEIVKRTTATYKAKRFLSGSKELVDDILTTECALQVCINDKPFTMTMRTPGSDKALVRGLLYSENVVPPVSQSYRYLTSCIDLQGNTSSVNVLIDPSELLEGYQSERSLMSVSSCGICGKQDADDIVPLGDPITTDWILDPQALENMFDRMSENQNTFISSGGSHGASAFSRSGDMLTLQEDIGRHNAVDKVIGQLILDEDLNRGEVLLVSGRVSFEIITKAYRAGFPFLAAVSAPSSLAVEMAEDLGICLLAFCRGDKCTVYSCLDRVDLPSL